MYRLILGTLDELQEILEIAKQPINTAVKMVPLTELAQRATNQPYTTDWEALEALIDQGEGYRASVEFLGIYKTLDDYFDEMGVVAHLEAVLAGNCETLPLVMLDGVVGVPLYINSIRYNIIRKLGDCTPVTGRIDLGGQHLFDLPSDSPVFSPAEVFNKSDLGRLIVNYDIFYCLSIDGVRIDNITNAFINPDFKAILMEYRSNVEVVPAHRRDVSI